MDFHVTIPPQYSGEEAAEMLMHAIVMGDHTFAHSKAGLAIRGHAGEGADTIIFCLAVRVLVPGQTEPALYTAAESYFGSAVGMLNDHDLLGRPTMDQGRGILWVVSVDYAGDEGTITLEFDVGGGTTHPSDGEHLNVRLDEEEPPDIDENSDD